MKNSKKSKIFFLKNILISFLLIIIVLSTSGQVFAIDGSIIIADAQDEAMMGAKTTQTTSIGVSTSSSLVAGLESASTDLKKMVDITENGYEINANYALRILRALEEQSVNTYAFGFRDEDYDAYETDDKSQTYKKDDELTNILDKYLRAELKNMLPDLGEYAKTAVNGNVVIKRYTAKFGRYNASDDSGVAENEGTDFEDGITLKYIPYDQLLEISKRTATSYEQTQEYLTYFSINPIGFKLCILVSQEEYTWAYNNFPTEHAIDDSGTSDPAKVNLMPSYYSTASSVASTFEMKEYEYLNLLEQTATPINFFVAMQMIAQDVDFMNELLEECNKENSYIELGFLETTESEFTHYNYGTEPEDMDRGSTMSKYTILHMAAWACCEDEYEYVYDGTVDEETGESTPTVKVKHKKHDGSGCEGTEPGNFMHNVELLAQCCAKYASYTLKDFLNVKIKNTGDLYLIKANTWNLDYNLIPKVGDVERGFSGIEKTTQVVFPVNPVPYVRLDTDFPPRPAGAHCGANHYSKKEIWQDTYFDVYENYASWKNQYHVYSIVNGQYDIDFLVDLLKKYPYVSNNFSTGSYLLFSLLEQNGNTQELERYMRYLLSQITAYQYLNENTSQLEYNFAVGLTDSELYSYNYDGTTTSYDVDVDSSANSSSAYTLSGGSGRTAWHLEKITTIATTNRTNDEEITRTYHYFKQESGTNICGRTSLATCLSGLGIVDSETGQPYTPTKISSGNTNNWFAWSTTLSNQDGKIVATKYTNNIRAKLIEHLSEGNPAIVHIKANSDPGNPYNTKSGHFIAVVGIKNAGTISIYVLDPGSSRASRTENYINIDTVLSYADEIRTFKIGN